MTPDDIAKAIVAGVMFALLGLLIYLVRAAWRRATDPELAKRIGSGMRRSIDSAASAAGQTATTLESVARSAAASYKSGRGQSDSSSSQGDRYDQVSKLRSLLDQGAISLAEYEREKARILNS